jgi:hypothetical protein
MRERLEAWLPVFRGYVSVTLGSIGFGITLFRGVQTGQLDTTALAVCGLFMASPDQWAEALIKAIMSRIGGGKKA